MHLTCIKRQLILKSYENQFVVFLRVAFLHRFYWIVSYAELRSKDGWFKSLWRNCVVSLSKTL